MSHSPDIKFRPGPSLGAALGDGYWRSVEVPMASALVDHP